MAMEINKPKEKFKHMKRSHQFAAIGLAVVAIVVLIWFGTWLSYRLTHATTNAAFVKADLVDLSPLVPGHVSEILVDEGTTVKKGDVLAVLDDRDYKQVFEKAQAYFEQTRFNYGRYEKLYRSRSISKMQFESSEVVYKTAKADLEMAKLNLEHTKIIAPFDGVIAKRYVQHGSFVGPGLPVFNIFDPATIYVIANLEEGKLAGVKVGQSTDIWVDAYPGIKIKGVVERIGEASAAEFALIPRDTSAGEFTKVVQRVPIKIAIPNVQQYPFLRPGLSAAIGIAKDK
jgi:membrane fusion protein (multidrug efflux system)